MQQSVLLSNIIRRGAVLGLLATLSLPGMAQQSATIHTGPSRLAQINAKPVNQAAYLRALQHRDQMLPAKLPGVFVPTTVSNSVGGNPRAPRVTTSTNPAWEFIGPNNLQVPFNFDYGTRPLSGRVSAVAYDPQIQGRIYAGAANGGLWRSDDNGVSWTPLTDTQTNLGISCIAVDPTTPIISWRAQAITTNSISKVTSMVLMAFLPFSRVWNSKQLRWGDYLECSRPKPDQDRACSQDYVCQPQWRRMECCRYRRQERPYKFNRLRCYLVSGDPTWWRIVQ